MELHPFRVYYLGSAGQKINDLDCFYCFDNTEKDTKMQVMASDFDQFSHRRIQKQIKYQCMPYPHWHDYTKTLLGPENVHDWSCSSFIFILK